MYRIIPATTKRLKKMAFRLRHEVFVVEDGKFQDRDFQNNEMRNEHDDEPSTVILLAFCEGKPVATISLYAYSKILGLPVKDTLKEVKNVFDFQSFLKKRTFKSPLFSCGMLAIMREHQGSIGLLLWLYRFLFELAERQGCRDIIVTINHAIEPMLARIGLERLVPEKWYSEEIGNHIYLLYATLDKIRHYLEVQKAPE